MFAEVKNYLLSVKDRTTGAQWGHNSYQTELDRQRKVNLKRPFYERLSERWQKANALIVGTAPRMFQVIAPLTSELWDETIGHGANIPEQNTPFRRALNRSPIFTTTFMTTFIADLAGNIGPFLITNNPAEGLLVKTAVNAGSHMLVDSLRQGVNNFQNPLKRPIVFS